MRGSNPADSTKFSPCSEMVSPDVWDVVAQVRFLPRRPINLLGVFMSRTIRKDRKTQKKVQDGHRQFSSKSCEHHGGCPWCLKNRTFDLNKINQEKFYE